MQWASGLALKLTPIVRVAPSNDHESIMPLQPWGFRVALIIMIRDKNSLMHDAVQAAALPGLSRGM